MALHCHFSSSEDSINLSKRLLLFIVKLTSIVICIMRLKEALQVYVVSSYLIVIINTTLNCLERVLSCLFQAVDKSESIWITSGGNFLFPCLEVLIVCLFFAKVYLRLIWHIISHPFFWVTVFCHISEIREHKLFQWLSERQSKFINYKLALII